MYYVIKGTISKEGDGEVIGAAAFSTLLGCATGGITVLSIWKIHPLGEGKWSLSRMLNGCIAGMVSVCAGCSRFLPWASALVSCVAGFVYVTLSVFLVKLKIDDPLDAVAVHAGSGKH